MSASEFAKRVASGEPLLPPVAVLLGIKVKSLESGHAILELEVDERFANPMGTLHGGIYCDLADLAMGLAFAATLQERETFTTVEFKISFLRPVTRARLTAETKVIHAGRTLGLLECDIRDERLRSVARAWCTCMKRPELAAQA